MQIIIKNQNDLTKAMVSVANLTSAIGTKAYSIEIKEHREKRSKNANDYFHVLVHKIAEKLKIGNDECKVKLNLEYGAPMRLDDNMLFAFKVPKGASVKDVVKYPKWYKETNENGKLFDCYMVYKETHTLDSAEMARLIDGTIQEAQSLDIETKTPDELAQLKALWGVER